MIATLLATAALLAGGGGEGPRCYEDEPCWNWARMGNRDRGVTLNSGRHVVVGTCRFQRLSFRHRIDWCVTPRLKGDRWALRYGCGFDVQTH